jgi:hypothetical protein
LLSSRASCFSSEAVAVLDVLLIGHAQRHTRLADESLLFPGGEQERLDTHGSHVATSFTIDGFLAASP